MKKDRWHNIPYGYKEDPEDTTCILPISDELKYLEESLDMIEEDDIGYATASEWLTIMTDRAITPQGLRKIHAKRLGN